MITEEEARERILGSVKPLTPRNLPLAKALNCFVTRDYLAATALPNFDNSAMDGYAVASSSVSRGARLRVIGEQPAGPDRKLRISPGQAVRIFTGAPIPAGADAVVMQEDVVAEGNEIIVNTEVAPNEFIRRRGSDLSEGQKILTAGERLWPGNLALLAGQGFAEVAAGGEVTAGVISTGDELTGPGKKLKAGQIYDSNSVLLETLLTSSGAVTRSVQHCRDNRESLEAALAAGIQNAVLLISGGVSVGEHDLVQSALQSMGAKIEIWRVAIKPGKPILFSRMKQSRPSPPASAPLRRGGQSSPSGKGGQESARRNGDCLVFGLPGNPVSGFVTFLKFVRPAILKLMGAADDQLDLRKVTASLGEDTSGDSVRPHYIRGRLEDGEFQAIGRQESHALFGLSRANALLRVAARANLKQGTTVEVEVWD